MLSGQRGRGDGVGSWNEIYCKWEKTPTRDRRSQMETLLNQDKLQMGSDFYSHRKQSRAAIRRRRYSSLNQQAHTGGEKLKTLPDGACTHTNKRRGRNWKAIIASRSSNLLKGYGRTSCVLSAGCRCEVHQTAY